MKVLILGASGLVGSNALDQTLAHPFIAQVIAPTRKPLPPNSKLINPVSEQLDFLLPEVLTWKVDAVICALGTTKGKAGSKEAFRQVDYVLPLAFARLAHQQGAETFALVSAIGADVGSSFFYPKTKGEVERDIKLVGFRSLTILRPSIIGGKREDSRFCRRGCVGAVPPTRSNSSKEVPHQSRSEDRRSARRQHHCSGAGVPLPVRRKLGLAPFERISTT